jgi:hypothetical protein
VDLAVEDGGEGMEEEGMAVKVDLVGVLGADLAVVLVEDVAAETVEGAEGGAVVDVVEVMAAGEEEEETKAGDSEEEKGASRR